MNKYEKKIYKIIKENGKIRYLKLQNIILENEDMAKATLLKHLANMVTNRIAYKKSVSKQGVEYYVDRDLEEQEQNTLEFFDYNLPEAKRLIEHISKNKSKFPIEELAGYIVVLWKIINALEYKGEMISLFTSKNIYSKRNECEELRRMLLIMMFNSKNLQEVINLFSLTDAILQEESIATINLIKTDLHARGLTWTPSERKPTS